MQATLELQSTRKSSRSKFHFCFFLVFCFRCFAQISISIQFWLQCKFSFAVCVCKARLLLAAIWRCTRRDSRLQLYSSQQLRLACVNSGHSANALYRRVALPLGFAIAIAIRSQTANEAEFAVSSSGALWRGGCRLPHCNCRSLLEQPTCVRRAALNAAALRTRRFAQCKK